MPKEKPVQSGAAQEAVGGRPPGNKKKKKKKEDNSMSLYGLLEVDRSVEVFE